VSKSEIRSVGSSRWESGRRLNVADPVFAGLWGKAAFDSVGPLLLIGWAEAGPGFLRALSMASSDAGSAWSPGSSPTAPVGSHLEQVVRGPIGPALSGQVGAATRESAELDERLVERARRADAEHWRRCKRPISAETLRKQLRVGATTSRVLVAVVRSENVPAVGSDLEAVSGSG
jgi:hypothetical protein